MSTHIILSKGRARTRIDPVDYDYLTAFGNWCLSNKGYAVHYTTDPSGDRKVLYMHRLILKRMSLELPRGWTTDHINRDRLDNRRRNLRPATRCQQVANQSRRSDNTSGYRGVREQGGRFRVQIIVEGETHNLGTFSDAYKASLLYDAAQRHFNGEFAGCNHPDVETPSHIAEKLKQYLRGQGGTEKPYIARRTSPYRGVSWHAPSQSWRARTTIAGQRISLGYFDNDDEAAAAIRDAKTGQDGL